VPLESARRSPLPRFARIAALGALVLLPASASAAEPAGYDARDNAPAARPAHSWATAQSRLRSGLGKGAVVRIDRLTGTPRMVGKRQGLLTGRSGRAPRSVALGYLHDHATAFGLDAGDLDGLRLAHSYRSADGTTHLRFEQTFRGIPAFGAGVQAGVTRDGRLVNLVGAPRPDLAVPSTSPMLSRAEAVRAAKNDVGPGDGDRVGLVLFPEARRVRLAWRLLLFADSGHAYDFAVDAADGDVLARHDLTREASGLAFDNYPGAPAGGTQVSRTFDSWLTSFTRLEGNNALAYSDENDSIYTGLSGTEPSPAPGGAQLVPPQSGSGTTSATWSATQLTQGTQGIAGRSCPPAGCTWNDFDSSFSWTQNRRQAGTQVFYFVNNYHDWLRDDPGIAFDEASGNFEEVNSSGQGSGSDPVHAQVDDGAALDSGFPDCDHSNNANMTTFPEGYSPRMQMYLFSGWCGDSGMNDVNGGDDAFIVYHEYTHGLSGRLVTDSGGNAAVDSDQSGAMGEAWSDWYAHDYLVSHGLEADTSAAGELPNTPYAGLPFRTQPMDCSLGSAGPACPGTGGAGSGGYTYGDFGEVVSGPEVHADGEIWAETLWDLRKALVDAHPADGLFRTRALVTDGLRLSPPEPSFLDMRDAILQADSARGFGDHDLIMSVFTARGMGACASTTGGADDTPVEDFRAEGADCSLPPPPPPPPSSSGGSTTPAPTSPAPQTTTTAKPEAPATPRLGARLAGVTRRGGFVYSFSADPGLIATLSVTLPRRGRRAAATLARRSLRVPASGRATLRLRLSRRNLRLLRRKRRLVARVTVTVRNEAGSAHASSRVTLYAPRR
jgi:extracellular elastinolytic metalloproteinase